MLVSTAIAGGAGYVVTILARRSLDDAHFVSFAALWSALYVVVGTLAGVQQEVARSSAPGKSHRGPIVRNAAIALAAATLLAVAASSPLWAAHVFGSLAPELVPAVAIGSASYVAIAAIGGVMYGLDRLHAVAVMTIADGLLRLAAVAIVLQLTHNPVAAGWAVALPIPVVALAMYPYVRSRLAGRFTIDVDMRGLLWNIARASLAAAAVGVLVSGFPSLIAGMARGAESGVVAAFQFASQLTRSPLIVVALALQTFLVVRFRELERVGRRVLTLAAAALGAGVAVGVLFWFAGDQVSWLLGTGDAVSPLLFANLVASAGVVASLAVTGAALMARSAHGWYAAGWVAAAAVQVLLMLGPGSLEARVVAALWLAPAAGLVVHALGAWRMRNAALRDGVSN